MFKEGISSIFAKKKTKSKEEEEDSGVTAILDVFGNGQVGRVTSPKKSLVHSQTKTISLLGILLKHRAFEPFMKLPLCTEG